MIFPLMLTSFTLLISCCAAYSSETAIKTLTAKEADVIIAEREDADAARVAARFAELDQAEIISEGRGVLPSGQEVIIREVLPPVQRPVTNNFEASEQSSAETLSAEEFEALQQKFAKSQRSLLLSVTVFDHQVSRLQWKHEGEIYLAYSNVNFNYLRSVTSLETETASYMVLMGVGDISSEANPYPTESIPLLSDFPEDDAAYLLIQGDPAISEALDAIDALLAYYEANRNELAILEQRRDALSAAQKRYDAANPKEPIPFIMQFWTPETGSNE